MGKRREPRKPVEVPVRIFGTDSSGRTFSETVSTVDISRSGARLGGVAAQINIDEIIGVAYGSNKTHFKVKWAGAAGTLAAGQVGVLSVNPEKPFWDFPLPAAAMDNFRFTAGQDRRKSARVKCAISVELHPPEQALIWGRASDVSTGGCFVEMPTPLPENTKLEIVIWLADTKLRLKAEVASASPGFGIGLRFIKLSPENQDLLRRHIDTIG